MNFKSIIYVLGCVLVITGAFMLLPVAVGLLYGETTGALAFLGCAVGCLLAGFPLTRLKARFSIFTVKDGYVSVALCWIVMSLVGALPFAISGEIPSYLDALFEIVSGFTTTGASILSNVEALSHCMLFWRSFSHWVGGMGVLVFLLAFTGEKGKGFTMHLLRAESPGPDVGKLAPKMRTTAGILYIIYIVLTVLNVIFLLLGDMPPLEAVCHALGTAGTGGFGVKGDSFASYSPYLQNVTTVFMILFGVNFSCYYLLLMRQFLGVFRDEELRLYFGIILGSILLIFLDIRHLYGTLEESLRHAAFQVGSIITTTGYATTDFDLWPSFSKTILLCLMVVGACAGSTGGGIKVARILLLFKSLKRNIAQMLHPRKVKLVRNNGSVVDERILSNTNAYLSAYVLIVFISFVLISLDGFSTGTNFSAVLACLNNIGPGLETVGPVCNYSSFSAFSKLVLTMDMLLGRLEIFPILVLFSFQTWKNA